MTDIEIKISKETRMVYLNKYTIGNDSENLQGNFVFKFTDEFVNGAARLEYVIKGQKYLQILTKEDERYIIPIKSVLTKKGEILMQLVIVEPSNDYVLTSDTEIVEGKTYFRLTSDGLYLVVENPVEEDLPTYYEQINIPVFKSNVFKVYCNESINAEEEQPDEYPSWIEIISTKLAEIDEAIEECENLDLDVERVSDGVEITITKKDGSTKSVEVYDGQGGGGTGNYEELENKPQINGHTLIGNLTGADLELEYDDSEIKQDIETINGNVETLSEAIEEHDTSIQNIENDIDTIEQDINDLGIEIDNLDADKVPTIRKVNNKQLNQDITLTPSDIGIGSVFTLKGSVATIELLPSTGNVVGDVYYVESEEVGYIWLEKSSVLQWEQLGLPIDLSNYVEKNQISTITLTGSSGTLTDSQISLILTNKKNIVINVSGDNYYLSNDENSLTYITYFSIIPTSNSNLEYKALYIQIDSVAVNYKHWNIEEIVLNNNNPVIITAESNTTINGYQVPELTTEDIQAIYNGIVAGREVVVVDATENMHFKVNQADTVSDEIFISFLYFDIMILQYDENENITYKELATTDYVDNAIGTALEGSY